MSNTSPLRCFEYRKNIFRIIMLCMFIGIITRIYKIVFIIMNKKFFQHFQEISKKFKDINYCLKYMKKKSEIETYCKLRIYKSFCPTVTRCCPHQRQWIVCHHGYVYTVVWKSKNSGRDIWGYVWVLDRKYRRTGKI